MSEIIKSSLEDHLNTVRSLESYTPVIKRISSIFASAIRRNKKIIFFGNGGSAADAQHLAAELVGRFKKKRRPLSALALTTNTSILTALGNDFGFEYVFSMQIEAMGNPGDIAVGISTSGNSKNVLCGLQKAKEKRMKTVGFLGRDGGEIKNAVEIPLIISSDDTARIQEAHILIGHIICEIVERKLFNSLRLVI